MAENENDTTNSTTETPEGLSSSVKGSDWRVVLLGLYLLVLLVSGVYILGALMTAETQDLDVPQNPAASGQEGNSNSESSNKSTPQIAQNSAAPISNASGNANIDTADNSNASLLPDNSNSGNSANANKNSASDEKQGATKTNTIPKTVRVVVGGRQFQTTSDGYVFLVVLFSGLLGAVIRCVFSFFRHIGVGDFAFRWIWYYLMLPLGGATLSLVLYFVIRGGFYSSTIGEGLALNLFSFAALGALTGLFSGNAMEKLKQVAETLLAPEKPLVESSNVQGDDK